MPIGDLLAQITGEPSPTLPTATLPPKRKADGELRKPVDKLQRTEKVSASPSRPVTQLKPPPSTVSSSMANTKLAAKKPVVPSPTATTFKNGQPTPPPSTGTSTTKPAKKGSFAEIMARAKAQQATLGQVGKIQHKKIEKLPSKREREEMKAQKAQNIQKNVGPNGKFRSAGHSQGANERGAEREGIKKRASEPEKKIKKAAVATTGYAGTARPKPGGASAPSRYSASASSRYGKSSDRYSDNRYGSSSKRYSYPSEDEEEEEEEEGDDGRDYDSDGSSDMEAAAFEVDEEEEAASRIARREDAAALAEENRLKREKEEKKRRLAALAKSRR